MNEDDDLKTFFRSQREQIRLQAPAWQGMPEGVCLKKAEPNRPLLAWLTVSAGVVLLGLGFWTQGPTLEPKLSEALPVLLDAPNAPLFAGLDDRTSTPSDLFLPVHLQLRLP